MNAQTDGSHSIVSRAHYNPPWQDVSIIGVAGSSGSGKSTLSKAVVAKLNLPWVVILPMDTFYKSLGEEDHKKAFKNEYDFDTHEAIDFKKLLQCLQDLKAGKRAEIPTYSFEKHQRTDKTDTIYSPHVLILEGIYALYDQRILDILDMKIFCEADLDVCLSRRILRDVKDRGRTIEGVIEQWFKWVKPNFEKFVDPQRKIADIIIPRGVENLVAIDMVTQFIEKTLSTKSKHHRASLTRLERECAHEALSPKIHILNNTTQIRAMDTIIHDTETSSEDFIFYFDRLAALMTERALDNTTSLFKSATISTPINHKYKGLLPQGEVSAMILLRGGAAFETGLRRVIPDCKTGRILIQGNQRTGEPELHFSGLPAQMETHDAVLVFDAQMSSGGAALMAVQVLLDHGVEQDRIVFVTYSAGRSGLHRLTKVFPDIGVVVCNLVEDREERWVERRYFGC